MRKVALLRQAPIQACQAGTTRTRMQQAITLPPAPAPAFPTSPSQVRGTPTFQTAPTLSPVKHTCNTMDGVAETAPNPSVPGFPGIFTLIEDGLNMTARLSLERLATFPLGEWPPLMVCLEALEPHIRECCIGDTNISFLYH